MTMNKLGLCCISLCLKDEGYSFQTMTYKRFSSLPRNEALEILGERIENNLLVTAKTISYCAENNWVYRLSSNIFPLITYDIANVALQDLPNYENIQHTFNIIRNIITTTQTRVSCHPSEFNVLASTNTKAVDKTIVELNFYSWFFDQIGLEANYNNPINIHIHNRQGSNSEVVERFISNFDRLDPNCRNRLVIENDDKVTCWSVKQLIEDFYPRTKIPITFDYLHHACHPDFMGEKEAIEECYATWHGYKPLFHYSESRPGNNPRAHADYPEKQFNNYGLDFDVDMELKMKDLAIQKYEGVVVEC